MKIAVKEFRFNARLVRSLAEKLYGKMPDSTWSQWRKWAQVKPQARSVSGEHALRLLAIAHIRKKYPKKELSPNDIKAVYPVVSPLLVKVVEHLTLKQVPGSMAIEWLENAQGLSISESTLRRRLNTFGRKKLIPTRLLEEIAKSA